MECDSQFRQARILILVGWWPFDEITTQHIGIAIAFLLTAIAIWVRSEARRP